MSIMEETTRKDVIIGSDLFCFKNMNPYEPNNSNIDTQEDREFVVVAIIMAVVIALLLQIKTLFSIPPVNTQNIKNMLTFTKIGV